MDTERGAQPWRISLIAATVLVLELALIRLVPAEVRVLSYFTNLVLLGTFFGLGLGCILQRSRALAWLLPAGLALLAGLTWLGRGVVIREGAAPVHFWLQYGDLHAAQAWNLPLLPAAATAFLATALPFVALGQALAREMERLPRLPAYGWDLGGSLGGTLLFSLGSWLGVPPWVWPSLLLASWAALFARGLLRAVCLAVGLLYLAFAYSPLPSTWSPYYLVQRSADAQGLRVFVNSSFHQYAIDFTRQGPKAAELQELMLRKWGCLYDRYQELYGRPPRKVLVLGAGTGNDVHVALARGAEQVVAVEIDPVILRLGREENPSRPYADPRVTARVDDARHALRALQGADFDLVVFGTLDSQILLSASANLRLENYVYTREALAEARGCLRPGGLVGIYYSVMRPWLLGRLFSTARGAFGDRVELHKFLSPFLFNTLIVAARDVPDFGGDALTVERYGRDLPITDDWPFPYLERPTIAPIYWQLFAVIAVLIAGAFGILRHQQPGGHGLRLPFLCLGVGFTLMESSAIVRLSLLFGSTWTVNAVVFAAVLLTIFLGNLCVLRGRAPRPRAAWVGLLASVALNWALPVASLAALSLPARVLACAALIGAPVFCAALCFSRLFATQETTGYALGVNLVGAMAGGVVEYVSMLLGMRAVWALVGGVYLLAWLSSELEGQREPAPLAEG